MEGTGDGYGMVWYVRKNYCNRRRLMVDERGETASEAVAVVATIIILVKFIHENIEWRSKE